MKKTMSKYASAVLTAMMLVFLPACNVRDGGSEVEKLSVRALVPEMVEPGQTLSIVGDLMETVTAVTFEGNVMAESFQRIGINQIDVVVPAGAKSGKVHLRSKDDEAESEAVLRIAEPAVTTAYPADLQTNDVLTINGRDLNVVSEVIFPDDISVPALLFERKCNERITVKVPSGTIDGTGPVKLKTFGGDIIDVLDANITVVEIQDDTVVEAVVWEGSAEVDWSDTKITFSNDVFAGVPAGAEFIIYFNPVPTNWAVLKIKRSVSKNNTFDNAKYPEGNWGYAVDENSTECSFTITDADLAVIADDPGGSICVQGQGYVVVTKVVIRYIRSPELLLWEGRAEVDWSDTNIAISNAPFAAASAGSQLKICFEPVPTNWAVLKIKRSVSKNSTFDNAKYPAGNWGYAVDENSTECIFEITDADLAMIADDPGGSICVQGQGYVKVTSVYLIY